jgi:hypothetical protein
VCLKINRRGAETLRARVIWITYKGAETGDCVFKINRGDAEALRTRVGGITYKSAGG